MLRDSDLRRRLRRLKGVKGVLVTALFAVWVLLDVLGRLQVLRDLAQSRGEFLRFLGEALLFLRGPGAPLMFGLGIALVLWALLKPEGKTGIDNEKTPGSLTASPTRDPNESLMDVYGAIGILSPDFVEAFERCYRDLPGRPFTHADAEDVLNPSADGKRRALYPRKWITALPPESDPIGSRAITRFERAQLVEAVEYTAEGIMPLPRKGIPEQWRWTPLAKRTASFLALRPRQASALPIPPRRLNPEPDMNFSKALHHVSESTGFFDENRLCNLLRGAARNGRIRVWAKRAIDGHEDGVRESSYEEVQAAEFTRKIFLRSSTTEGETYIFPETEILSGRIDYYDPMFSSVELMDLWPIS